MSEVGRFASAARIGFQVLFVEREPDMMAIGGRLPAGADREPDVLLIDVAVMDGEGRREVRAEVIEHLQAALANACGLAEPSPAWWVNFRSSTKAAGAPAVASPPSSPSWPAVCSPRRRSG